MSQARFAMVDAAALEQLRGKPCGWLAVYTWLCLFASKKDGAAWPAAGTLADHSGLSLRTVRRALRGLLELGVIELAGFGQNGTRKYRCRALCVVSDKCSPGVDKKSLGVTPVTGGGDTSDTGGVTPVAAGGDTSVTQTYQEHTIEQTNEHTGAPGSPTTSSAAAASAISELLSFPRWLRDMDSPQAKKKKTAEIVTAWTDAGWNPDAIPFWAEAAKRVSPDNPAAWLYSHLDGYANRGWKPVTRDGNARKAHAALMALDWPAAKAALDLEASYAAQNRAAAEAASYADPDATGLRAFQDIAATPPQQTTKHQATA